MDSLTLVSALVWIGGYVVLARIYPATRGTTLRAPWLWALLTWTCLGLVWGWQRDGASQWALKWRYIAAVGTCCPGMALLGAKRPQDRGWQFVVVTLWLVLAWPALQSLLMTPRHHFSLHFAWRALVLAAIGMGVSNHLPTSWGGAALAWGAAQVLLTQEAGLRDAGWGPAASPNEWLWYPLTVCGVACGLLLRPRRPRRGPPVPDGWERAWLDFRNAFGCVWALRVAERVNQVARSESVPIRLGWYGFEPLELAHEPTRATSTASEGAREAKVVAPVAASKKRSHSRRTDARPTTGAPSAARLQPALARDVARFDVTLRGILRRFVSDEWLAARGVPLDAALGHDSPRRNADRAE